MGGGDLRHGERAGRAGEGRRRHPLHRQKKERISNLGSETLGRLLLDTGFTKNVCGQTRWRDFHESLSTEDRNRVRMEDGGGRKFRFGGGKVLTATEHVKFPVKLAGREVMMSSHVVSSPIPLLWSKPSMIKAGVVVDLPEDKAKILGNWTSLDITSAGHRSLQI